jgi:hypothetical protein
MKKNTLKLSTAFYKEILKGWLILGPIFIGLLWVVGLHFSDISDFFSERAVRQTGVLAKSAKVEGESRSIYPLAALGLIQFNEYDLKIIFTDDADIEQTAKIRFYSMSSVDRSQKPVVWYDKEDPSKVALSWSVDLGLGRLAYAGLHWFVGLLALGLIFLAVKASLRKIARYKACTTESIREFYQVRTEPLSETDGKQTGVMTYTYVRPGADGRSITVTIQHSPLIVKNDGQDYVIGLKSFKFPDEPIIVSSSLYEFSLIDDEKARLISFDQKTNI